MTTSAWISAVFAFVACLLLVTWPFFKYLKRTPPPPPVDYGSWGF